MLRFRGLENPGKRHRSWKTLDKSWISKLMVLEILISRTGIASRKEIHCKKNAVCNLLHFGSI